MEVVRGSARLLSLVAAAVLVVSGALPAAAAETLPTIVFPVAGPHTYTDTFGAPRSGHTHAGEDILADKMTPVVAASSGTVRWIGSTCCYLELTHDDGWSSMYIHLNNDTPGTDDGLGWGIAPGIDVGVHVEAGQLIGWVGDSGNAEYTVSHLHFELHDPSGTPVNPYPALQAAELVDLPRIAGADRYATAVAVSQTAFLDGAGTVFLATGAGFADALAGAATAGSVGGPILLTTAQALPVSTANEIVRLGATHVVVLGGEGAISDQVLSQVSDLGVPEVTRLAGADRFGTAVAISSWAYPDGADAVVLVDGLSAPDALSGSPAAARLGAPLLMATSNGLPTTTSRELLRLAPTTIYVLGGTAAITDETIATVESLTGATVERVAGADRYATSRQIALRFFTAPIDTPYLATGLGFADALAAGPLGAVTNRPVLLVSPTGTNTAAVGLLDQLGSTGAVVIGGVGAVPKSAVAAVCAHLPAACS